MGSRHGSVTIVIVIQLQLITIYLSNCNLPAGLSRNGGNCRYLFFTQRPEFSPRKGDSLHRFTWNFAWPRGALVCLAVRICTSIGARGRVRAPQSWKFLFFDNDPPHRGKPFDRFVQGAFMRPTTYRSILNLRWFASQITELFWRNRELVIYPEFFRAPCRKNYALDRRRTVRSRGHNLN